MAGQQTKGRRYEGFATGGGAGGATARDLAEERRRRRDRDAPIERAYNAGLRGEDPAEFRTSDELAGYYQQGRRDARTQARRGRRDELVGAATGKAGSLASDGAGFLLGLFAYALLANFLRHGTRGVTGWLRAKFINDPDPGLTPIAGAAPAKPTKPATGGGGM